MFGLSATTLNLAVILVQCEARNIQFQIHLSFVLYKNVRNRLMKIHEYVKIGFAA